MEYYHNGKYISSIADFLQVGMECAKKAACEIYDIVKQIDEVSDKVEFFHDDNGRFLSATKNDGIYYIWIIHVRRDELTGRTEYISKSVLTCNEDEIQDWLEYILVRKVVQNLMDRLDFDENAALPCNGKQLKIAGNGLQRMFIPFDNDFPYHRSLMVKLEIAKTEDEGP